MTGKAGEEPAKRLDQAISDHYAARDKAAADKAQQERDGKAGS